MQTFGVSSYQSKYGAEQLKKKYDNSQSTKTQETPQDSFNPKYKSKKKNNTVLGTLLLVAGTAFAVYKGHGKISAGLKKAAEQGGKQCANFKKQCPNLAQAGKSLAKACETPKKHIANAGKSLAKPLQEAWNGIKGIFAKKA